MKTAALFAILFLAISGESQKITSKAESALTRCPEELSKDCPYPQGQSYPDTWSMFCEYGVKGFARQATCPEKVSKNCPYPQGQFPVYFAHPDYCSKFCECGVEGFAWEVTCADNLLWNDQVKACDCPANVECGGRANP